MPADKDSNRLVSFLEKYTPGNLPPAVFEAVARIAVYPAVEFIPLRMHDGRVQVLLFERPDDDIVWPSMLHTPGTVLRPTDQTYQDAFDRLRKDELADLEIEDPLFMGAELSHNRRGACVLIEFLVIVTGEPTVGCFYDVDDLPPRFIEEQRPSLERAVVAYAKR